MRLILLTTTVVLMVAKLVSMMSVEVPSAPEILSMGCHRRSTRLTWTSTGQSPVKEFRIQYMTSWSPNEWINYPFLHPIHDDNVPLILNPWTNYTFRVIAVNNAGASNASLPSDWCQTEEDVPHKNPDNVYGRGNGPKNLVISWTPMPPREQNAPGFFYTVYYKQDDMPTADWHIKHVLDWQQSRLIVENLPKLRPYRIKVEAYNSLGKATQEAREVIGYSDEDMPSEAPKDLRLVDIIDGRSAHMSWQPVPPLTLNGHFKGYKLQVWTDSYENRSEQIVSANTTKALITIFKPAVNNTVQVQAFNGAFDGPVSNNITVSMPVDVYPDTPAFMWTRHTDRHNRAVIRITYEPNWTNDNPGRLIYIEYRRKGIDSIDEWTNTVPEGMDESNQHIDLVDLEFDKFYEIRVVAQSGELKSSSNISTIDTGLNKWPKPTTTTTREPPPTYAPYVPPAIVPSDDSNRQEGKTRGQDNDNDNRSPIADEDNGADDSSSKTPWIVALVVVLLFIAVFVTGFIYLKKRHTSSASESNNKKTGRNKVSDKIRSVSMTANPNEINSLVINVDNQRNNTAAANGSLGHDEGDDNDDDDNDNNGNDDDRHRQVYNGTTESRH
ncbi:neuroglian-like [Oppia nitens]|uniref:neuroglian-like n=1 Tax=Oppia nitens TaxID=1686743 RepID=UPI0023DB8D53|nr:neuroglian-like [Oppia nitens]